VSDPHSTRPRVAIVILQWRRPEETVACLRTVSALAYQAYDVLVVDNHSADGSVTRLREEFPSLAIYETPANLGFAGGCNVGIRSALVDPHVDYVMLLNNDTRVPADLLDTMVAAAEADPDAAAVGAVNLCGEGHAPSGGQLHWWTGRYVDVLDRHPLASLATAPVLAVDTIAGSSMLIRASVLRAGELLDPAYFCIYEETDWCVRQRRRGGRVLLATRARLEHKGSGTMGRPLQLYYRFRNRPYFMAKHANPAHWVTFLPYYVGEAAGRIIGYALAGRREEARAVLLGVLDAARGVRGPGRIAELTS
jgi:GT2 family glycosyltransferase